MKDCNIFMANHTLAEFMYWLVKKVHKEQKGVRFHWHGEVLITIEPTTEWYFENGYRLDEELYNLQKQRSESKEVPHQKLSEKIKELPKHGNR